MGNTLDADAALQTHLSDDKDHPLNVYNHRPRQSEARQKIYFNSSLTTFTL